MLIKKHDNVKEKNKVIPSFGSGKGELRVVYQIILVLFQGFLKPTPKWKERLRSVHHLTST
jgi:hypothetical protein